MNVFHLFLFNDEKVKSTLKNKKHYEFIVFFSTASKYKNF